MYTRLCLPPILKGIIRNWPRKRLNKNTSLLLHHFQFQIASWTPGNQHLPKIQKPGNQQPSRSKNRKTWITLDDETPYVTMGWFRWTFSGWSHKPSERLLGILDIIHLWGQERLLDFKLVSQIQVLDFCLSSFKLASCFELVDREICIFLCGRCFWRSFLGIPANPKDKRHRNLTWKSLRIYTNKKYKWYILKTYTLYIHKWYAKKTMLYVYIYTSKILYMFI